MKVYIEGVVTGVQVEESLACTAASYWLSAMSAGVPPSYSGDPEEAVVTEWGRVG